MDYFLEILKAIVFGIVEGITEWLPVSSTGHMIILNQFFGFSEELGQGKDFLNFFLVIIQLGAIMAVVISFFKELWPFGKHLSSRKKKEIWQTWLKILVASVPAGVVGLLFDDFFDEYLYNYLTVSITLIVYGIVFLVIEIFLYFKGQRIKRRYHLNRSSYDYNQTNEKRKEDVSETELTNYPLFNIHSVKELTVTGALIIGLAQMLALIPGTSRSGITICAALLMSVDRRTAAKFSFYMSIPAMLGGTLIKAVLYGFKVYRGTAVGLTGFQFGLIAIAMAVAFVVSFFVIRFFMRMLRTKSFVSFGIYRIGLGVVLLIIFFVVNKGNLSAGVELTNVLSQTLPLFPSLPMMYRI